MKKEPRYSIKKYILILVVSASVGVLIGTIILSIFGSILGFGSQGVLIMIILSFPVILFSVLYAFYGGLVRHYGLKGDEKLFFGGKF
jgi:hypothetical protein